MKSGVAGRAIRLLLALAALALASCSFTKLAYMNATTAYSNATPVLAWLVDDYVDTSGRQKGWVKDRLSRAMAWHRTQELPEYRRFFEAVRDKSRDGVTVDEARDAYRQLRVYYQRAVTHIVPDIADLLLQLDAEQVAQLERKFASDNRKMVKESTQGSPRERFEKRVDKFLEHIEEFTGSLSESQRGIVASHVKELAEMNDERLGDRRYRQTEILAMIRAQPPREQAIAQLQRLLVQPETWRRPEYQEKLRDRDERICEMIAALSTSLTPEQQAHFQRRLSGFIRDIGQLAARSD